jgi:heme ABC exporter ATP-binding subunit CcmA
VSLVVSTAPDFRHVTVTDVARHYGRRKALSQVSFECHAGEIIGLLGPNGAGKSTLLSILSTLVTPSVGEVKYGGQTAVEIGAVLRSRIGLLGHDLYLYPELSARQNLTFFAQVYGLAHAAALVRQSLEHANLTDRADDQVLAFSRGMRQRLALERALVHGPRLLLLDEPFTGLDQASAAALVTRLKGLQAEGCLIIAATHDLEIAEGLLTRVIFLRNGRMVTADAGRGGLRARYQAAMSA